MPNKSYQGGRYLAVMLAECLALNGHEVHFVANASPIFLRDFDVFGPSRGVPFWLTLDFRKKLPPGPFDVVLLVPGMAMPKIFALGCQLFALERGARLVFLDFESGAWFNALSPVTRPLDLWTPWQDICRRAACVLSNSREGWRWAKKFYRGVPKDRFQWCRPAINTFAADAVRQPARQKRIVLFARHSMAEHKGAESIHELLCPAMATYTLVIILGSLDPPDSAFAELRREAAAHDITIELQRLLTDREKFLELKRAALLLFPSLFEGYGYPPLEALYCGTPCVAFDLPVLRETCGEHVFYAPHGDWEGFRRQIGRALEQTPDAARLHDAVAARVAPTAYAAALESMLQKTMAAPPLRVEDFPGPLWRLQLDRLLCRSMAKAQLRKLRAAGRQFRGSWRRQRKVAVRKVRSSLRNMARRIATVPRRRKTTAAVRKPDVKGNAVYRALFDAPPLMQDWEWAQILKNDLLTSIFLYVKQPEFHDFLGARRDRLQQRIARRAGSGALYARALLGKGAPLNTRDVEALAKNDAVFTALAYRQAQEFVVVLAERFHLTPEETIRQLAESWRDYAYALKGLGSSPPTTPFSTFVLAGLSAASKDPLTAAHTQDISV